MNGQTIPMKIEGYTVDVPETVRPEYQRAYAAYFLHSFLGTTAMTEQTPKLHAEFYGEGRSAVETQKIWRQVGHQAHEDAQRFIDERTNAHQDNSAQKTTQPKNLVDLMVATGEHPALIARVLRTRTGNVIA